MTKDATFSLLCANCRRHRNFLIACGLAVFSTKSNPFDLQMSRSSLSARLTIFRAPFSTGYEVSLRRRYFRHGRRHAFFDDESILEVTAPIAEAQFLETLILNQIGLRRSCLQGGADRRGGRGRVRQRFWRPACAWVRRRYSRERAPVSLPASNPLHWSKRSRPTVCLLKAQWHTVSLRLRDPKMRLSPTLQPIFSNATLLVDTYDSHRPAWKKRSRSPKREGADRRFDRHSARLRAISLNSPARRANYWTKRGLCKRRIVASGGLDERSIERL